MLECKEVNKLPEFPLRNILLQGKADIEAGIEFSHIITVGVLSTGAPEVIINTEDIEAKINYLLLAYGPEMQLERKPEIRIKAILLVNKD